MSSTSLIPVATGSAASAEIISIKLDEAAELTSRLKRILSAVQKQIEISEKNPEEKNSKLAAIEGAVSLISGNIHLEASTWDSNARARARRI